MRLSKVRIKNFKSIKEIDLRIPERDESRTGSADFVSILGENNAGKSSILEAIRLALPGGTKPTLDHFPGLSESNGPIDIELEFNRLTEKDKEEQAIRAHVYIENGVEKYRIKKTWTAPNTTPDYFAFRPDAKSYDFADWQKLPKNGLRERSPEWRQLVEAVEREHATNKRVGKAEYLKTAIAIQSSLIIETESNPWTPNPGGQPIQRRHSSPHRNLHPRTSRDQP